jgi:predicted small secreted protein
MNRSNNTARALAARLILLAVTLSAAAALSGCNAVQGIGKDITAVGSGGQDLIDEATGSPSSAR